MSKRLLQRVAACLSLSLSVAAWAETPPMPAPPAPAPPAPQVAADTQAYIHSLQAQARQRQLAGSDAWRALLHIAQQPLTRQNRSLADDPGFFLSPQGRTDAQAELDATLAALADERPIHALDQPAACRFIARAQWLREALQVDAQRLPEPDCARYRQWRQGIAARTVVLVFPSAFINSPASMYGHTFLRLDPAGHQGPGGSVNPLLSYSINYAANGTESDGIAFAIRGLTGLYEGTFSTAPYYTKLTEYSDLENRDVWEYELDLTEAEVDRLMAHTWELGPTRFDYYFFDENCAYHLLSLLDVARPGLRLTEQFVWRAIPIDTVRAVQQQPGLVRAIHHRAANSTELRARVERLGPALTGEAHRLAHTAQQGALPPQALAPLAAVTPGQQALVLETAERLVAYNATRSAQSQHDAVQAARMRLLAVRAGLPAGDAVVAPRPEASPTDGHDTIRADVQQGQRNGHAQTLLQIRPAYHDLMDPERGYQRGAAIEFFNLMLGKRGDRPWELERFMPVAITSLAPHEPWLDAASWRIEGGVVRTAFGRRTAHGEDRPLAGSLHGGPGRSWDLAWGRSQRALVYGFVDNQLWWDRSLQRRPFAIGSGLAVGALIDLSARWRVQTEGFARAYLGGAVQEHGALWRTRWQLDRAWNLTGECQWQWRQQDGLALQADRQCTAGLQRYF